MRWGQSPYSDALGELTVSLMAGTNGTTERIGGTILDEGCRLQLEEIDACRNLLSIPDDASLFPSHFLKTTFWQIGGLVVVLRKDGDCVDVRLLFPRNLKDASREYTLRRYKAQPNGALDNCLVESIVQQQLPRCKIFSHDPSSPLEYCRSTVYDTDGIDIGTPSEDEASSIRELQRTIWGTSPNFLYPSDIHSTSFQAGTSLVARVGGALAGFLFGFYRFGGPSLPPPLHDHFENDLRIESQLLGIVPELRGKGIAVALKRVQAMRARSEGIAVIHWTVDPLQFRNALLNFGHLKAIAFEFHPDHYAFRNKLNLLAASRLKIAWFIDSPHVTDSPSGSSFPITRDLCACTTIRKANEGWATAKLTEDARIIAIEIPANWTQVQNEDLDVARRWRETTNTIFRHYIGHEAGKYMITGIGHEGPRKFLLAEQANTKLLEQLGGTGDTPHALVGCCAGEPRAN